MAIDITTTLDDELEAELVKETNENNSMPGTPQLTPAQFFRREARERLRFHADQRADAERTRFRAIYNAATAEDKAAMDAIAAKYPGVQR
jgi:hypothetical protein